MKEAEIYIDEISQEINSMYLQDENTPPQIFEYEKTMTLLKQICEVGINRFTSDGYNITFKCNQLPIKLANYKELLTKSELKKLLLLLKAKDVDNVIRLNEKETIKKEEPQKKKKKKVNRKKSRGILVAGAMIVITASVATMFALNVKNKDNVLPGPSFDNSSSFNYSIPEYDEIIEEPQPIQEIDCYLRITCKNSENDAKAELIKEEYGELITKYANMYGIPPEIMMAIACQESPSYGHSEKVSSGGGLGLFQIQVEGNWNWDGKTITAFNQELGRKESVQITKENARDLENNIKYGCMIFKSELDYYSGNIYAAICSYNHGSTDTNKIIGKICRERGIERSELLANQNSEFIANEDYSSGDPNYSDNVFRYLPDGTELVLTYNNGEKVVIMYEREEVKMLS